MKTRSRLVLLAAVLASTSTFLPSTARAQYPHIPDEVRRASEDKKRKADARSDEIFNRQLPQLEADAMLGAMLPKIQRFEAAGEAEPWMTTIGHGPARLPVRAIAA